MDTVRYKSGEFVYSYPGADATGLTLKWGYKTGVHPYTHDLGLPSGTAVHPVSSILPHAGRYFVTGLAYNGTGDGPESTEVDVLATEIGVLVPQCIF
jgi:hypothetical protein